MEKAADQPHTVLGSRLQGHHGRARQLLRRFSLLGTGQPVAQVLQQEYRVPGIQAQGLGRAVDMQPAMALDDQVEAGPGQALGAGVPASAVASDVKQAGIEFQAF